MVVWRVLNVTYVAAEGEDERATSAQPAGLLAPPEGVSAAATSSAPEWISIATAAHGGAADDLVLALWPAGLAEGRVHEVPEDGAAGAVGSEGPERAWVGKG